MRTIESPGVEINEIDLSFNTQLPVGTTVLAVGYAKQGPTDELVNVTSMSEFEQVYGLPTNAAERYLYHTVKQTIAANGTLLVTRLPYGSGGGDGYSQNYSALVYPVYPFSNDYSNYTLLPAQTGAAAITTTSMASIELSTTNQFSVFKTLSSSNFLTLNTDITSNGNVFTLDSSQLSAAVNLTWNSGAGVFSGTNGGQSVSATVTLLDKDFEQYAFAAYTATQNISDGALTLSGSYIALSGSISPSNMPLLSDSSGYYIGQPVHVNVSESEYLQWQQGGIVWKDSVAAQITSANTFAQNATANAGYGGLVIVNTDKSSIDELFAGYYIAIADNTKTDKGSNYDVISNVNTINSNAGADSWITLNTDRLAFALTGQAGIHSGSVSEIVETTPTYDFSNTGAGGFNDSIILTKFRLRPTIYNQNTRILDKVLYESYIGSFDSTRKLGNQYGNADENFFLEDVINKRSNTMKVFINPNISKFSGLWWDQQTGDPLKKVRVTCGARLNYGTDSTNIISTDPAEPHGSAATVFTKASITTSNADNMYAIGDYVECNSETQKYIGNLPYKLERALRLADNRELIRIDIVPEGGLGTIWTSMNLDPNNYTGSNFFAAQDRQVFDDSVYLDGITTKHPLDLDSNGLLDQDTGSASEASDLWETIYGVFNDFVGTTRKDCLYVADPLRNVFVQGDGRVKVLNDKTKNFSQHIYWPLKNLFGSANSSYACTYANWFKTNDPASNQMVWMPPSPWAVRAMIQTDTNFYPWYAPAGLTRGIMNDVVDIAVNPNEKQRGLLYKIGINPTVYWPGDGYVIWGQKTLQKKPSAFDRINVRRLFLWCEKAVLQIARYFVFEQNTVFTRNRLKTAIDPVLAFARDNEGIYEYLIVCDERNNTPEVIDRNELVVDIYIKPVRVAEFILINFIATRTGQNFEELI